MQVHALQREVGRRSSHRAAIVYGALPPGARSQQAARFNQQQQHEQRRQQQQQGGQMGVQQGQAGPELHLGQDWGPRLWCGQEEDQFGAEDDVDEGYVG